MSVGRESEDGSEVVEREVREEFMVEFMMEEPLVRESRDRSECMERALRGRSSSIVMRTGRRVSIKCRRELGGTV